jgi:hypothetical protein
VKLPLSKQILAFGAILAAPISLHFERVAVAKPVPPGATRAVEDPRTVRLHHFLNRLHCPVKDLAEEFVQAADDNDLDWRLLPSISVIESGGGKAYKNNNVMGWANGDWVFPTVRAGIHQVANRLGKSFIYRDRSTDEKLHLYNPNEDYPGRVEEVMNMISPFENLKTVSRIGLQERSNSGLLSRN